MKYLMIVLFAVAVAVPISMIGMKKLTVERTQTAALRIETEEKAAQIERLEAERQTAREQKQELARQADELTAELQRQKAAATKVSAVPATIQVPTEANAGAEPGQAGFGTTLAKMMKDPAMKKLIRDQQRAIMDPLYKPLVKQLGLSPEGASQFKDMLAETATKAADSAGSLLGGSSPTNRAEAVSALAAGQKTAEAEMKSFLGEAGYAQYQDYQQTVAERMQLMAYQQTAGAEFPLTDQQTEQLLGFMKEEKQNLAASGNQPSPGAGQGGSPGNLSDTQVEQLLQTQQALSQRVYDRARTILSPDQANAFGTFQTNQIQMMRMGMTMARTMFSPDPAPAGP